LSADAAPRLTYCKEWNGALAQPVKPMTAKTAQRRYEQRTGPWFSVVVGDPAQPDSVIEINWADRYVGTKFPDKHGSIHTVYGFRLMPDDRLFLKWVTHWEYPDRDSFHDLDEATVVDQFVFETDGRVKRRTDRGAGRVEVEERHGVEVDTSWEPVPKFGKFDSITRYDRDRPPR
jgi:hypothetical protein